jgi:hypothetical protein
MKLTPEFPPLSSYSVASVLKLLILVTDALDNLCSKFVLSLSIFHWLTFPASVIFESKPRAYLSDLGYLGSG